MKVSKSVVSAAVVGLLYLAGSAGVPAGPRPSRAPSASDAPPAAEPVPGGAQRRPAAKPAGWELCACEVSLKIEEGWDGSGTPIPVRITIRNKGPRSLYRFRSSLPGSGPRWTVRDAAGRLISPAEEEKPVLSPEEEKLVDRALVVREGSYQRMEIRPAEEFSYTMHLGPRFRLGAGTYTLAATVGVHLSDITTRVEVASTPVKVNVRRAR